MVQYKVRWGRGQRISVATPNIVTILGEKVLIVVPVMDNYLLFVRYNITECIYKENVFEV